MDSRREFPDAEVDSWLEREIASCRFDDVRHGKRLGVLLEQLSERIGGSIPFACQDWAATKAAYRFFANARISEDKILAGHFLCTRERFASARGGPVQVLHDTSEFVYRACMTGSLIDSVFGDAAAKGLAASISQRRTKASRSMRRSPEMQTPAMAAAALRTISN